MFKLIRDKIPELTKKSGNICNYAKVESPELFAGLLRSKLIEEVNEYLASGTVDELVDIITVIKVILKANNISEEDFDKLYKNKLDTKGGFEKQYIGFYPDAPVATAREESEDK